VRNKSLQTEQPVINTAMKQVEELDEMYQAGEKKACRKAMLVSDKNQRREDLNHSAMYVCYL
jgi:hypothetical protein